MGKHEEVRQSRIAGKARAMADLDLDEIQAALPSFMGDLEGRTELERYQEVARALGYQAGNDAARSGAVDDWIETWQDPRDIRYETWEGEHVDVLEAFYEASAEAVRRELPPYNDLFDRLFAAYTQGFELNLGLDWGEDTVDGEDEDFIDGLEEEDFSRYNN